METKIKLIKKYNKTQSLCTSMLLWCSWPCSAFTQPLLISLFILFALHCWFNPLSTHYLEFPLSSPHHHGTVATLPDSPVRVQSAKRSGTNPKASSPNTPHSAACSYQSAFYTETPFQSPLPMEINLQMLGISHDPQRLLGSRQGHVQSLQVGEKADGFDGLRVF